MLRVHSPPSAVRVVTAPKSERSRSPAGRASAPCGKLQLEAGRETSGTSGGSHVFSVGQGQFEGWWFDAFDQIGHQGFGHRARFVGRWPLALLGLPNGDARDLGRGACRSRSPTPEAEATDDNEVGGGSETLKSIDFLGPYGAFLFVHLLQFLRCLRIFKEVSSFFPR